MSKQENEQIPNPDFNPKISQKYFFSNIFKHKCSFIQIKKKCYLFKENERNIYLHFLAIVLAVKNIGSENPLLISGYMGSVFDQSDDTVTIFSNQGLTLLGVLNNSYTGWVNVSSTQGVS